jgi:tripartite-type tricarboxylate transporter receptor subunit TctC
MWGPPALPRDRTVLLHAATARLLQSPDTKHRFAELGAEPVGSAPETFRNFLQNEIVKWEKVVKASGARAD